MPTYTLAADLALNTPAVMWYRWHFHLRCGCRFARHVSVRQAAPNTETLLRDVLPRLRCRDCGEAPRHVALRNGMASVTGWRDEVVLVGSGASG